MNSLTIRKLWKPETKLVKESQSTAMKKKMNHRRELEERARKESIPKEGAGYYDQLEKEIAA